MQILNGMSLWDKVKLLIRIALLKDGLLKYQTIENYCPSEEDYLDIKTKVVFFWQANSIFCWNGHKQDDYKSYADYKASQQVEWGSDYWKKEARDYDMFQRLKWKDFKWETATREKRQKYIEARHAWPGDGTGRLSITHSGTPHDYGIEKIVLQGGETGFFERPPITQSGVPTISGKRVSITPSSKERLLEWVESEDGKERLRVERLRQHEPVTLKGYPIEETSERQEKYLDYLEEKKAKRRRRGKRRLEKDARESST